MIMRVIVASQHHEVVYPKCSLPFVDAQYMYCSFIRDCTVMGTDTDEILLR